jgi:hypothetical protein
MRKYILLFTLAIIALPLQLQADMSMDFDNVFSKIAEKLAEAERKLPNKTVAVYGFEVIGRPGDTYAVYATEKLTHEIVEDGTYSVIERSRIEEIMKEQNLSLSGVLDAGTASKIGKILAVDAVIIGTIHVTDKETEFIARIIASEKGLILGSADEKVKLESGSGEEKAAGSTPGGIERPKLSTNKATYSASEEIIVTYSGLPENDTDWITLVTASSPDTTYGAWFYTDSNKAGTYTFGKVEPGEYEVRLYFDYPAGGYEVQDRVKIKVKK